MARKRGNIAPSEMLFAGDQQHLFEKSYEEKLQTEKNKPVEFLGMTFPDDNARRKHFLGILRKKLKDPEFRTIEGFPIGSDEDILALSDPPYYTACPNPFIMDFIKHDGKPYDPNEPYSREPFASDTGAGKTHPIYTAHSYHSKIPHLAIMPCILHYTQPGDIVFDGFSGSGMTGVAAQLCGQPEPDFKAALEKEWKDTGFDAPKWGARTPVMMDLSPVANFIGYNLNLSLFAREFEKAAKAFFKQIDKELGWMYETLHTDGKTKGRINYVVWSQVFTCPNCAGDVVYMDQAYDSETGKFAEEFECPHCKASMTTRSAEHKYSTEFDKAIGKTTRKVTYAPVEIEYILPGKKGKHRKKPDSVDLALIARPRNELPKDRFPSQPIPKEIYHYSRLEPKGVTHFHDFYLPRALHGLSVMWRIGGEWSDTRVRGFLKFMVEQCFWGMTMMNRYGSDFYSQVNRFMSGVFYLPTLISETSPWLILDGKFKRLLKMLKAGQLPQSGKVCLSTTSSLKTPIPNNSVDYVYTDLPFGDFVPYGDLNLLIESWHELFANLLHEVLVDKKREKSIERYGAMMRTAFAELYRILKPGRWATIVFHNSKNAIWNVLQDAIGSAGFVIADVRTMNRGTGSYRQYTAQMAVKADVIISAYKPNGGLEERFKLKAGTEEGAWDFVRTHLKQLPVFVSKDGQSEVIAERQNYLLFDRMVAFHVQRGVTVPLSAAEFYAGLAQRFSERDGMHYLPEQVAEYDKKRMTVREVLQLELFVTDESSAIQWLKQQLIKKTQTFQELHPHFLKELGGWQKYEKPLELSELLEQNFLRYDGKGEVPSQIHSYLSTNFKELRNLSKGDESLRAKGKDRWYVPDPNKAGDLEKLRERSLLKEFEEYRTVGAHGHAPKRLKVFRLEAVRAGFKKAWQERDYTTIISVARKIPENVLQEDPKLLMWFDQAVTRTEG
ncbi:MAG: DNA methyltransferase [Deltaproteobacteria bacterium]|nr:DNA methyltransferase [Deltaproteobacteria bacterium]